MSIASQLNKQYNKPRPKLALGLDSSSALTLLSTSSSTRSFSIGGGVLPLPAKKQPLEEEKAETLDDAREELEPVRTSVHGTSRGPGEFESDRILAAMWLKSRCGSSVDLDSMARPLRRDPAASTSSAPSTSASAAAKASAVFAAKKNSIVRQCTVCNLLYTSSHFCPGIGPS